MHGIHTPLQFIEAVLLLGALVLLGNYIAQRIWPTYTRDDFGRRFSYRVVARVVMFGLLLAFVGVALLLGW